ncbi:hypothetical protein ACLM45_12790 [Synechococcus sp. A10-1-5-9]|uniref:hypothetical protein n=1 Tax=Synechococcus sp. A10-1-5-9 TaxID=3392295 RepID=UPI0039E9A40E
MAIVEQQLKYQIALFVSQFRYGKTWPSCQCAFAQMRQSPNQHHIRKASSTPCGFRATNAT